MAVTSSTLLLTQVGCDAPRFGNSSGSLVMLAAMRQWYRLMREGHLPAAAMATGERERRYKARLRPSQPSSGPNVTAKSGKPSNNPPGGTGQRSG